MKEDWPKQIRKKNRKILQEMRGRAKQRVNSAGVGRTIQAAAASFIERERDRGTATRAPEPLEMHALAAQLEQLPSLFAKNRRAANFKAIRVCDLLYNEQFMYTVYEYCIRNCTVCTILV